MLRIQELCKERGMTMQVLAENKLGITYQALYASVSGNPTLERLQQIASALEVDITELFDTHANNDTVSCPYCGGKIKVGKE